MKKKRIVFWGISLAVFLGGGLQIHAQDTIRYGDSCYLFHEYTSISPRQVLNDALDNIFARYSLPDSNTIVYGIAYTSINFPFYRECAPGFNLYRQTADGDLPSVSFVDSVDVFRRKEAYFLYEYDTGDYTATCYEFYFDQPHGNDELTTNFFISRNWPASRWQTWYAMNAPIASQDDCFSTIAGLFDYKSGDYFWGIDSSILMSQNSNSVDDLLYWWGGLFPIVQLRCVTPELCLEGRGHRTATVSWRTAEQPEMFELAIGDYMAGPETATVVTVADSLRSYTFTDLDTATMLGVWVRKGCRYTTSGYDTLVYSDWSQPLGFTALGIEEAERDATFSVSPNPTHGRVTLTLSHALTAEGELTLCDLGGREVRRLTVPSGSSCVTLDTEGCPAGAYLLKLVTPHGVATRRLLVE